ncbi:hypothetical protein [Microcoleus sp. herbarium12]|jgi:hypothetical protein|uniref:hypothetical protein n=1 Tax=Microcoleus sp. herbarium12 TaxID=3055437 RepID=UPI002FD687B4
MSCKQQQRCDWWDISGIKNRSSESINLSVASKHRAIDKIAAQYKVLDKAFAILTN